MARLLLRRGALVLGGATLDAATATAQGDTMRADFEDAALGSPPAGITTALTGGGSAVALWTKADSVTSFDNLIITPL